MLPNGSDISFSVIMPTFNESAVLDKTLFHITHHTETSGFPAEIIVVDGGSEDNTVDIARTYTSKVYNLQKRGIAKARNFGAKKARGSVLAFLDADMIPAAGFFEKIGNRFQGNGIAGVSCDVKPLPEINPTYFERAFYSLWGGVKKAVYCLKPCGTGENGIIVRNYVFKKVHGFNENLRTLEDLDFMFRASKIGTFIFLREPKIYETIRRFRKLGALKFSAEYLSNFLYYTAFKDAKIKEWEPVR